MAILIQVIIKNVPNFYNCKYQFQKIYLYNIFIFINNSCLILNTT
jgi:hypothetical protein